jgi:transcriptional regulator with XRE-family HTH domain
MDFYERVKVLAKKKKITIEAVANIAGLSIDSYNSYKRHDNLPRADEAVKIAKALGTTVEYLVEGDVLDTSNLERTLEDVKRALADIENRIADSKLR